MELKGKPLLNNANCRKPQKLQSHSCLYRRELKAMEVSAKFMMSDVTQPQIKYAN